MTADLELAAWLRSRGLESGSVEVSVIVEGRELARADAGVPAGNLVQSRGVAPVRVFVDLGEKLAIDSDLLSLVEDATKTLRVSVGLLDEEVRRSDLFSVWLFEGLGEDVAGANAGFSFRTDDSATGRHVEFSLKDGKLQSGRLSAVSSTRVLASRRLIRGFLMGRYTGQQLLSYAEDVEMDDFWDLQLLLYWLRSRDVIDRRAQVEVVDLVLGADGAEGTDYA